MLVLSRKKDESIVINDNITIVVVEIRGDKVRLGIEAPKEVPVHRREVFESISEVSVSPSGDAAREQTVDSVVRAAHTDAGTVVVENDLGCSAELPGESGPPAGEPRGVKPR
jgi:carbon storage regulator